MNDLANFAFWNERGNSKDVIDFIEAERAIASSQYVGIIKKLSTVANQSDSTRIHLLSVQRQARKDKRKRSKKEPVDRGAVGTVYVIHSNRNVHKIGITSMSVENRRAQIENGGRHADPTFKCVVTFAFRVAGYKHIERFLHERYSHKQAWGEWFNLTQSDLQDIRRFLSARDIDTMAVAA